MNPDASTKTQSTLRNPSNLDAIRQRARSEIARPTLDLTRQFLQVLPLQLRDGEPVIAGVNETADELIVYFAVLNQEFFLAISLEKTWSFAARWVQTEPGSRVYLRIDNSDGKVQIPAAFPQVETTKSGFCFDPLKNEVDSVENKIERLLNLFEIHREAVKQLASQTYVCLNVAYYGYQSQMWGFHFDAHTLSRLSKLNIELDLDLYASGQKLQELENFDLGEPTDEKKR